MKRMLKITAALLAAALLLTGCSALYTGTIPEGYAQFASPKEGDTVAVFNTSEGTFKAVLFPEYAPLNVENFIALARAGYYDKMDFHRVVADLLIQSGDPTDTGAGGESSTGRAILNEFSDELHNFTGALGMAGGESGNRSQFYIVTAGPLSEDMEHKMRDGGVSEGLIAAYKLAHGAPHLDFRYTVIGHIYEGLEVALGISAAETDELHRPAKSITLNSVTIETYTAAANGQ